MNPGLSLMYFKPFRLMLTLYRDISSNLKRKEDRLSCRRTRGLTLNILLRPGLSSAPMSHSAGRVTGTARRTYAKQYGSLGRYRRREAAATGP